MKQILAIQLTFLALVLTGVAGAQQSAPVEQTPPGAVAPSSSMSKSQLKEQRKQQKAEEKSASSSANAAKANAKAKKAQDKALQDQEKVGSTAPTPVPATPAASPQN